MSVPAPCVAIVFGSVTPPQGDVVELNVHLGCSNEVSSFDVILQNWNGKYSPTGAYALSVGLDGSLSVGRSSNCPLLMTCHVESLKYESSPTESYVQVSGRCWGERLFRQVVTKAYSNVKGEDIVKDLLDYYVGLSHSRNGLELVENTDTTYTSLVYEDAPVFEVLKYVAESADKNGVIGFDFRIAPDGKFEFFPRNSKNSNLTLSESIEQSEYTLDVHRIRNRITVYGAADKSIPANKDDWTESLQPVDGEWAATAGTVNLDQDTRLVGNGSIRVQAQNLEYAGCLFTLASGLKVNADLYPELQFAIQRENSFSDNFTELLYDSSGRTATCDFIAGSGKWFLQSFKVGSKSADGWVVQPGFDWTEISKFGLTCWFANVGSGSFWIDKLFFGGCRYNAMREESSSQASFGIREQVEVNEELWSQAEVEGRAEALLSNLKDPLESLTLRSSVLNYGAAPLLAGDTVHVSLPVEGVNEDFRVLSVEYHVDGRLQTLETTLQLGREAPLLADYVYALKSKTDSLSRYKAPRRS